MSATALRPWTERVPLHSDAEEGRLIEASYAIDLGAIAVNDPDFRRAAEDHVTDRARHVLSTYASRRGGPNPSA